MSIRLENIKRDFGDFKLSMNLEVQPGELVSLLGPSGCGKSTTLRILAGFEEADSGSVYLKGKEISHVAPEKRNIGMVFQDYALFPHMTVFDNIAYGPRIRKWDKKRIGYSVDRFLEIVHLEGFAKRRTDNLSGGEQQRIALARALVTEPQLLLLDEPLSALDAKLRKNLRREIRNIQRELGITTLYVTHDQEEALAISDRIAVMNDGICLQYDTPKNLYRKPSHIFSAGFIGNSNLIRLNHLDRENKRVNTDLGEFSVEYISKDSDDLHLFFRPDKCYLTDEKGLSNTFSGKIVDEEYSGSRKDIEIKSAGHIVRVSLEEDCPIELGDEVILFVPREHCRIL